VEALTESKFCLESILNCSILKENVVQVYVIDHFNTSGDGVALGRVTHDDIRNSVSPDGISSRSVA
jgi:hypothetical protein